MASTPTATAKGTVPFGEYKTWYRVTGQPAEGRPALVVVHGGPGSTHDYLTGLSVYAEQGWSVVHYDQIGNGGSTHLPDADPGFWTPQLFRDELENLLRRLDIADDYVLFGQSWGGLLAAWHASAEPAGLRGLVIANAPASYPLWLSEMDVLRAQLPPGVDETLRRPRPPAPPTATSTWRRCWSSTAATSAASSRGPANSWPPTWKPSPTRRSTAR